MPCFISQIICPVELQVEIAKMKPDTGGTNIGPALSLVSRLFGARRRSRTALFILTQSALSGNVNGLYGLIRSLRLRGTKVYSIGIGNGFSMAQVQGAPMKKPPSG